MLFCFASRLSPPSKSSVVATQILKHFVLWSLITSVAIYGSEKMCLLFAYLPFFYQFLPIYRAPYSAYLIPMTSTYENLGPSTIQVPNLEHNLLKTWIPSYHGHVAGHQGGRNGVVSERISSGLVAAQDTLLTLRSGRILPNLLRIWGNLILGFDLINI